MSNVGGFHRVQRGIDRDANSRNGLLWEVERVLKERKALSMDMPKFLILENVTSLLAKRHRHNFEDWKEQLRKLGYYNKVYKLNSLNLGVPQHRQRLLMLSIFTNNNSELENKIEDYLNKNDLEQVRIKMTPLSSILKLDYSNSKYFNEAKLSQPNPTPSRNTIWDNNLKIIDENENIADHSATITTKQDRHPNSGNLYFDYPKNKLSKYRFLTPRECFLLMGFDENDYEKIIKNNLASRKGSLFFSRDKMYKLAGNSIVVNVLEQIFDTIVSLDELFFSNKK